MRLLQVSLRSLLLYSLMLVLISIPVSIFAIREIINEEVDESLALHSDQFIRHIKSYEYQEDIEMDLQIWDQLSYDIILTPSDGMTTGQNYETISMYDSIEQEFHPFRTLSTMVVIKDKPYRLTVKMSLVDNDELVMALGIVTSGSHHITCFRITPYKPITVQEIVETILPYPQSIKGL